MIYGKSRSRQSITITSNARWTHSSLRCSNTTLPQKKRLEDCFIKHKITVDPEDQPEALQGVYRKALIEKREAILRRDKDRQKFNLCQLSQKIQQISGTRRCQVWISPLQLRTLPFKTIGEADRLVMKPDNLPERNELLGSTGEVRMTYFNKKLSDFGQAMSYKDYRKSTEPNMRRGYYRTKTGLQKLLQQYGKLQRKAQESRNKSKLVMASRQLKLKSKSSMRDSDEIMKTDYIRETFITTNQHFLIHMRKDPDLLDRLFDSLCNFGSFQIRTFIRYHVLLVTRQADSQDKSLFMTNLIFRKNQNSMKIDSYEDILRIVARNNRKLTADKSSKLVESLVRITVEDGQETVKRKYLQTLFLENQDVTEVLISLLYLD